MTAGNQLPQYKEPSPTLKHQRTHEKRRISNALSSITNTPGCDKVKIDPTSTSYMLHL